MRKNGFASLVFALFLTLTAGIADAHRVIVFAWVEGDTVFTESKFPGGRKVVDGKIIVYDQEGTQLLEGKTDDHGKFSFKAPRRTAMKIVVEAGAGHRGEWGLSLKEVAAGGDGEKGTMVTGNTDSRKPERERMGIAGGTESQDEIRVAVERALENKLRPVMEMLTEVRDRGPTLRDVIGGIGYIIGLVGLAAYLRYRRKPTDSNQEKGTG